MATYTRAIFLFLILFMYAPPAFPQSTKAKPADAGKPLVLGVIREIQSSILGEKRTLNIYLPEGYTPNDTVKYPVIYLLDGGADEDFIHVVGLVQFNTFPWIDRIPKSIVVGIANTDRKRDFTYPTSIEEDKKKYPTTGQSQKFIAFLEKEVQPFIEKNYRASSSKTLIGQSLGGLLATEVLFKSPACSIRILSSAPACGGITAPCSNRRPLRCRKALHKKQKYTSV